MTEPAAFLSTTPRFSLPLLFAGQTQKEVTVNESASLIDFLLHPAVHGERDEPPVVPNIGGLWLVGKAPVGSWTGKSTYLAGWSEGGWRFIAPSAGMKVYDISCGAFRLFTTDWQRPFAPPIPQGGQIVDREARQAIADVFAALEACGIFVGT